MWSKNANGSTTVTNLAQAGTDTSLWVIGYCMDGYCGMLPTPGSFCFSGLGPSVWVVRDS